MIANLRAQLIRIPQVGSFLARRPIQTCLLIALLLLIVIVAVLWHLDLFNITFEVTVGIYG